MNAPADFLDTNVLVYAFSTDRRAAVAEQILARGCIVSVQGLNEFANVAKRELGMSWIELHDALATIRTLCHAILPMDMDTHASALQLAERHGFAIFDCLMLAAALQGGCETFWSEDMQHGAIIDGRLRIANPFSGV